MIAIDGSRFKAQNSKDKNFSAEKLRGLLKAIDTKVAAYLRELEAGDQAEAEVPPPAAAAQLQEKIAALRSAALSTRTWPRS